MPGFLMHVNAACQCTHAAPATIIPTQPRVLVSGQPVATMSSQIVVLPSPGPGPGLCLSPEQIPQGPPIVSAVQPRVLAT
jgi:hypothetical protein